MRPAGVVGSEVIRGNLLSTLKVGYIHEAVDWW